MVIQAADLMEHRKRIPDFATWVQCFNIYAVVIIAKEPERAKNLLAYMSLIAKCSLSSSGQVGQSMTLIFGRTQLILA